MKSILRIGFGVAVLAMSACQKQPEATAGAPAKAAPAAAKPMAVEVVKESERSKNFAAVNKHLELGGTLYGYVDIEGDVLKLMGALQGILGEAGKAEPSLAMFANQDLKEIATMLGLNDVKALGVSSVPDGTGFFRNKLFLHTGGERHGLLAAAGGKPGPLKHLGLAPADAAFFAETEMDVGVAYKTLKDVVAKVAGEPMGNQLEEALKKAGEAATLSFLDLIYGLKGRTAMVLRVDPEKTWRMPGGRDAVVVPAMSLLIAVDGVGQVVKPSLEKAEMLKRSVVGNLQIFEMMGTPPMEGLKPTLVVDGTTLFVTTSLEFFDECRKLQSGLGQTAEFKQAVERLGKESNGISFVSPRFFTGIRRLETLNENMPAQMKSTLKFVLAQVPTSDRPLVAVRTNLEDGILISSYYNRSMKQELAAVAMYNPVTVGMLAAMAIPAFQKVRTASQEKAILNNLRQLYAAADQYYLEEGKRSATYDDIVGPTKYVKQISPVAGEQYRQIRFVQGEPIGVQLPDGRMIQYPSDGPGTTRPQMQRTPQRAPKTKKAPSP